MSKTFHFAFLLLLLLITGVSILISQTSTDLNEGSQVEWDETNQIYRFKWWGKSGRTYFIQHSEDLVNWSWVPVVEPGGDTVAEWGFTSTGNKFFLRLAYSDEATLDPAGDDFDGDGTGNLDEVTQNTDPLDYYNGQTPNINQVSVGSLLGAAGEFVLLTVEVTDGTNLLDNAPVTFQTTGMLLSHTNDGSGLSDTIEVRTNPQTGKATVYLQMPGTDGTLTDVTVTAGGASAVLGAATQALIDTDNDGMDDRWEQTIITDGIGDINGDTLIDLNDVRPEDDYDGDRISNLFEYKNRTPGWDELLYPDTTAVVASDSSGTHLTVQSAIDEVADYALIEVRTGWYPESINIDHPVAILRDRENVGPAPVISTRSYEDFTPSLYITADAQLYGLIIQHEADHPGTGVETDGTLTVRIDQCIIRNNNDPDYAGGVINRDARLLLTRTTISSNYSNHGAKAIYNENGSVALEQCLLWNIDAGNPTEIIATGSGSYQISSSLLSEDVTTTYPQSVYLDPATATSPLITTGGLMRKNSPALDLDLTTPVQSHDIHNEPRTQGTGIDLGADEWHDSDDDGLPDWLEAAGATDPNVDSDNDGTLNLAEYLAGADPLNPDNDRDGLPDPWELDPNVFGDLTRTGAGDEDGDGLTNLEEYQLNTDPNDQDSDGDQIDDGWEVRFQYNPNDPSDADNHDDQDGLDTLTEYRTGLHPRVSGFDPATGRGSASPIYAAANSAPDNAEDLPHLTHTDFIKTAPATYHPDTRYLIDEGPAGEGIVFTNDQGDVLYPEGPNYMFKPSGSNAVLIGPQADIHPQFITESGKYFALTQNAENETVPVDTAHSLNLHTGFEVAAGNVFAGSTYLYIGGNESETEVPLIGTSFQGMVTEIPVMVSYAVATSYYDEENDTAFKGEGAVRRGAATAVNRFGQWGGSITTVEADEDGPTNGDDLPTLGRIAVATGEGKTIALNERGNYIYTQETGTPGNDQLIFATADGTEYTISSGTSEDVDVEALNNHNLIAGSHNDRATLWYLDQNAQLQSTDLNNQIITDPNDTWVLTSARHITENGTIIAQATKNGANKRVALLPVEIIRETEPGSGEFVNILNGGSDGRQIALPVYQPDSGSGRGESTTLEAFDYQIDIGGSFNSGSVDTINVQFANVTGSWNGILTETGNNTGIFENTGAGVTVTLSPVPTLSASNIDSFTTDISAAALGLSGIQLTVTETSETSNDFKATFHTATASLSSALSASLADTIEISVTDLGNGNEIELNLTETGDDTKVFSDGSSTLVASSLNTTGSIDILEAHIISPLFGNLPQAISLKETAAGSLFFNNLNVSQISITPEDPASNGQGVFYVRIPKIGETQEIKLRSGSNELAINATIDPTNATKLITGKLALIPDGVGASFSGVDVLQLAASATSVTVDILGGEIENKITKSALLARCFAGVPDTLAYPTGHMKRIEEPLTQKLGYTAKRDESTTLGDIQDELPDHSLFYFFGHGGFDGSEFVGMRVWSNGIPLSTKKVTVTPSIISTSVGDNQYRLAFVNGCSSADGGTVANAYPDAFNADAYVGWTQTANTIIAAGAGEDFFNGLDDEQTVQQAIIFAQSNGASSVTNLEATRGASERIDLSP